MVQIHHIGAPLGGGRRWGEGVVNEHAGPITGEAGGDGHHRADAVRAGRV